MLPAGPQTESQKQNSWSGSPAVSGTRRCPSSAVLCLLRPSWGVGAVMSVCPTPSQPSLGPWHFKGTNLFLLSSFCRGAGAWKALLGCPRTVPRPLAAAVLTWTLLSLLSALTSALSCSCSMGLESSESRFGEGRWIGYCRTWMQGQEGPVQ